MWNMENMPILRGQVNHNTYTSITMKLLLSLLICFSLSINMSKAQTYVGPKEDIDAILRNIKNFSQYYIAGDLASLVDSYTSDAKIFPTGSEILAGREAIEKYWRPNPQSKKLHHLLTPIEIIVDGDRATDYGYYEGSTQYKDNPPSDFRGKYLIVWKKIDGVWKIDLDIWNKINLPKQPSADEENVLQACYNYIDTWYRADTTLAHKSIHPSLRKAGYYYMVDENKYSEQLEMPFRNFIDYAAQWNANGEKANSTSPRDVRIFEISDKTAVAKVTAIWGIDYISLAKIDNTWKIINVLWQSEPR